MKINIKALALSMGITWGLVVFLLTVWFLVMGYNGTLLSKLGSVYLGYSISWFGTMIGFAYGFVDGFFGGMLIGYLYNKFTK